MKTNKLPQSIETDVQAAGSQTQQYNELASQLSTGYITQDNSQSNDNASNDASYESELSQAIAKQFAQDKSAPYVEKAINVDDSYKKANSSNPRTIKFSQSATDSQLQVASNEILPHNFDSSQFGYALPASKLHNTRQSLDAKPSLDKTDRVLANEHSAKIPERIFMTSLVKHTGIALAIIIPLAAFSTYAGAASSNTAIDDISTASTTVEPDSIIYNNAATTPTTVASVDLAQYAGTWYEIGRLPMYFQRNCARDVTATYTPKADGSGITVTNQCTEKDGKGIVAKGFAKSADDTGSKLKVTFLPSWIRWLPVGRADYWVLARDADYKTALVGTPDKDYLWLLARTPDITQQTYAKYRQIAQQQGYDLKEFNLTAQTNQSVNLIPKS